MSRQQANRDQNGGTAVSDIPFTTVKATISTLRWNDERIDAQLPN
jgi:hypothetical protein